MTRARAESPHTHACLVARPNPNKHTRAHARGTCSPRAPLLSSLRPLQWDSLRPSALVLCLPTPDCRIARPPPARPVRLTQDTRIPPHRLLALPRQHQPAGPVPQLLRAAAAGHGRRHLRVRKPQVHVSGRVSGRAGERRACAGPQAWRSGWRPTRDVRLPRSALRAPVRPRAAAPPAACSSSPGPGSSGGSAAPLLCQTRFRAQPLPLPLPPAATPPRAPSRAARGWSA
jgi:hypothetical protein